MTYNRFISGLKAAGVEVDRKILAELAVSDPTAFSALVELAKAAAPVAEDHGSLRFSSPTTSRPLPTRPARVSCGRLVACSVAETVGRPVPSSPEGRQAVAEALDRRGAVSRVIVADDAVERHRDLIGLARAAEVRVVRAAARDVAGLSDTVTPQGILAVCATLDVEVGAVWAASPRLVVLCDQIRDPGNLGTVIRCADAFGADAVLVSAGAVDLYNPKTVRASTGSLFHLPLAADVDLEEVVCDARQAGLQVLGADGAATETVEDLREAGALARPTLWVLGNEAWGLPPERAARLDRLVSLPLYGRAESLNLSTAAAVLLYASATAQREPRA